MITSLKKNSIDGSGPPGRVKIVRAFSELLMQKDFHSITTAQIAQDAKVTEGLIYKYFKDKKDLLYQVLNEHFQDFLTAVETRISAEKTCLGRLTGIIFVSLEQYAANRIFSRVLLLEVRNSQTFFESGVYEMVKEYSRGVLGIIEEGIKNGELRRDVDPDVLRKVIFGAIEHACLGEIIFGRELNISAISRQISDIVFNGVKT